MKKLLGFGTVALLATAAADLNAQDFDWNGRIQNGLSIEVEGVLG